MVYKVSSLVAGVFLLASIGVKAGPGMSSDGRSSRAICSSCHRTMPLRNDGNNNLHGPVAARCSGSGLPPAMSSASSPPSDLPQNSIPLSPPSPGSAKCSVPQSAASLPEQIVLNPGPIREKSSKQNPSNV
jgi:hypothetical protein